MSESISANSVGELDTLQRVFFDLITRELGAQDSMSSDPDVERLIKANDRLSSHERIELYARQYWWRLLQSIESDFPVLKGYLGPELFRALSVKYLLVHRSKSFTLRHLGDNFPRFIDQSAENLLEAKHDLAVEIAQFELLQMQSFFASTLPLLKDTLSGNPSPAAAQLFVRQPHVFPIRLSFPVHKLFEQVKKSHHRDNESNATTLKSDQAVSIIKPPEKEETFLVIYRFQTTVFAKQIDQLDCLALELLRTPSTIDNLLQNSQLVELQPSSERIFSLFKTLTSFQWIALYQENDL